MIYRNWRWLVILKVFVIQSRTFCCAKDILSLIILRDFFESSEYGIFKPHDIRNFVMNLPHCRKDTCPFRSFSSSFLCRIFYLTMNFSTLKVVSSSFFLLIGQKWMPHKRSKKVTKMCLHWPIMYFYCSSFNNDKQFYCSKLFVGYFGIFLVLIVPCIAGNINLISNSLIIYDTYQKLQWSYCCSWKTKCFLLETKTHFVARESVALTLLITVQNYVYHESK